MAGRRILFVWGNPDGRGHILGRLKQEGYEVVGVSSGEAALAAVREEESESALFKELPRPRCGLDDVGMMGPGPFHLHEPAAGPQDAESPGHAGNASRRTKAAPRTAGPNSSSSPILQRRVEAVGVESSLM